MSWATALFGDQLLTKSDPAKPLGVLKPTEEVLANKKFVLLYFSGSFCKPCSVCVVGGLGWRCPRVPTSLALFLSVPAALLMKLPLPPPPPPTPQLSSPFGTGSPTSVPFATRK